LDQRRPFDTVTKAPPSADGATVGYATEDFVPIKRNTSAKIGVIYKISKGKNARKNTITFYQHVITAANDKHITLLLTTEAFSPFSAHDDNVNPMSNL